MALEGTLIDADTLRKLFDIATQIVDDRLEFCIGIASRTLKGWVGIDAYEDAAGEDPEDADAAAALQSAEAYLAMYHALLNAGARIRKNGLISREQDAAGPMGSGNVINQYFTPKEIADLRAEYLGQAETFAAPYLEEVDQKVASGMGTMTMKGGWASSDSVL